MHVDRCHTRYKQYIARYTVTHTYTCLLTYYHLRYAVSFAEYLAGLRKTEEKVHPGYAISQGMVATTIEENRRLLAEMFYKSPPKPQQKSRPVSRP